MKAEIKERLDFNLERVEHLLSIYTTVARPGRGRKPPKIEDVLRAATVLLHASLEDFLRAIEIWRLPFAAGEDLKVIPLKGLKRDQKFTLGELAPFRGKSIQDVIAESVSEYTSRETYNNVHEVKEVLRAIGLNQLQLLPLAEALGPMMDRRHQIVHKADRSDSQGRGHNRTKTIARDAVHEWVAAVREFSNAVVAQLP